MSSIIHVFDRNTPDTTTVVGSPNSLLFTSIFPMLSVASFMYICHTIIHSSRILVESARFNSEVLGLLSDNIFLRTYLPGQCIFNDGDVGEFIYILMRGRVEVKSQGLGSGEFVFVWTFRLGKKGGRFGAYRNEVAFASTFMFKPILYSLLVQWLICIQFNFMPRLLYTYYKLNLEIMSTRTQFLLPSISWNVWHSQKRWIKMDEGGFMSTNIWSLLGRHVIELSNISYILVEL